MIDNRTPNRDYLLPSPLNKMKSEDVPRFIETIGKIDLDVAAVIAALAGKAASSHTHEMAEILGLVSALASKAAAIHSHNIGSLGGVSLGDAAANQLLGFNGTLWIPTSIGTVHLTNKLITNAKLRDSDPLTVIGRASASLGSPADISATANDRLLARVGDVLAFVQMTIGMVPDGLLTFAKLATAALANQAEAEAGVASNKLMTAERTAQAIAALGGAGSLKVTRFAAGATYTKDAKAKFVRALVQAGGGGGGGINNTSNALGAGGMAGVFAEALFAAADVGSTVSVTVGAGGNGSGAGAGNGSTGGVSSFGSLVSCPGGAGGQASGSSSASYGAIPAPPTIGAAAIFSRMNMGNALGGTVSTVGVTLNGAGLDSEMGVGGSAVGGNNSGDPYQSGYGAGGGGPRNGPSGATNRPGGAGGPGIVIIVEHF